MPPVPGALLPSLLVLHDSLANLEVGAHLERIHRGNGRLAGGLNKAADLGEERAEGAGDRAVICNGGSFLRGQNSVFRLASGIGAEAAITPVVQNEIQRKAW